MGKGSASGRFQVTDYRMSIHLGLCRGPVDSINKIIIGEKLAWQGNVSANAPINIRAPELFGGEKKEGGVSGVAYALLGGDTQVMPAGLAQRTGRTTATSPGYRGLTSLFFCGTVGDSSDGASWVSEREQYHPFTGELERELRRHGATYKGFLWSSNSPFIQPTEVEVTAIPRGFAPALAKIGPDANPAHIIYDILTDDEGGMGAPASAVDAAGSFTDAAQTLYDEEFGLTLGWWQQSKVEDFIREILDHIQAVLYPDPVTGKWVLKLLRDDYDPDAVPVFDMSNADILSDQQKGWSEIVNEIILTWTNPENEQEETISAQNLAAIDNAGEVVSTARNFYGIRNVELAQRVLARELRQASTPASAVEIEIARGTWTFAPGSVVRLNWPESENNGKLMRVMSSTPNPKRASVRVTLVEDIFALSRPALTAPPGTGWEAPGTTPEALEQAHLFTLPYALSVRALALTDQSDLAYPNAFMGVMGFHSDPDVFAVERLTEVVRSDGTTLFSDIERREVPARTTLASALAAEVSSVISDPPGAEIGRSPIEGGFALIGDGLENETELCQVVATDEDGWVLRRGIWDTVPRAWPIGTPVWFFDDAPAVADLSRVRGAGETAKYKLLARTSLGVLDSTSVAPITHTVTDRAHRPVRPANVAIEGQAFGNVSLAGLTEVTVTWSRRNRLLEDATPLLWDAGDVVPEAGQMTNVRALNAAGATIKTWLDVPGTSLTIPVSDFGGATAVLLQVFSARDDLASLQSVDRWLLASGTPEPSPPETGDLDLTLPGTSDLIDNSDVTGTNLCPDPYFQNTALWGFGLGPWVSATRLGSGYPAQLGVPRCALLSASQFTGSTATALATPVLGGLFGDQESLLLSARAKRTGVSGASVFVEVTFYQSQDGTQVGSPSVLEWSPGESGYKELKVTPPAGADARGFRIFNDAGTAWTGDAAISDIQLVRFEAPSAAQVGTFTGDAIQSHFDFAVSGSKQLAAGSGTLNQVGYQNDFADPLLVADGVLEITSNAGPVELIPGSPNKVGVRYLSDGADQSVDLILGPRHELYPGIRYAMACEVGLSGNIGSADLTAHFFDDAGEELLPPVSIATVGDGARAAGFIERDEIPEGTVSVEMQLAAVTTGAGEVLITAHNLLAAQTAPTQSTVPAFVDPQSEAVIRYLEQALLSSEEGFRLQGLEYRADQVRSALTILQQVTADAVRYAILGEYEGVDGKTRALISMLAADGVSEILMAAGVLAFVNDQGGDPILAMEVREGVVHVLKRLELSEYAVLVQVFGGSGHIKLGYLDGNTPDERRGVEIKDASGNEVLRVDDSGVSRINGSPIVAGSVLREALAANAASRTVSAYVAEHDVWPSGFGPAGNNANASGNDTVGANWPSKTLQIKAGPLTDVKAGTPVLVWISYKLTPVSSSYGWMYFEHEVFRRSAGAGIPARINWPSGATDISSNPYLSSAGLIDYEPLFDGVSSGNQHVSGNMGSNAIRRTKPGMNGSVFMDIVPEDGAYEYWFRWMIDARYSFAVDGFEGPTATRHPFLSDIRIIVTNLAK
jgi:hypothetical protein